MPLNLEVIMDTFFKVSIYHAGERSEPEKNDNTEMKTGIGPQNLHTGPHLWQISGGGGSRLPVPPLDPRMQGIISRVYNQKICE